MHVLRVERSVSDFAKWKAVFDSDPADRKGSGVLGYEILRSADDPNYVMINLQFGTADRAQAFLTSLQKLWGGIGATVRNPTARIAEHVVYKQL